MGYDNRGPREMFSAVCDKCGKNCQVPFKPTSGKPIFCSDCFEKSDDGRERSGGRYDRGGRRDDRRDDRRDSRRSGGRFNDDRRMYKAVCDNCGNDCEVPFRPTQGKPILCSTCFEGVDGQGAGGRVNNRQLDEKIDKIEAKLDEIIKMLSIIEDKKTVRVEDDEKVSLK